MKALHQGHPGMVKMKLRAKTSMYWIGINREIEEHVMQCEPCQVYSNSQQKEPAISMEVPSRSWEKIGADLFLQGGRRFLLVADYYSKYPWIFPLMTQTSKDVISAFQIMVFLRSSFVTMENSSQAENTRILQLSMDSSSLPAVNTTPRAMVS